VNVFKVGSQQLVPRRREWRSTGFSDGILTLMTTAVTVLSAQK